ncbi:amidohydrolase [Microbispora sp. ATCC PTA-5024]|uniref:amidohydrolase n=1 Tax=Microbispora sp. ATCC PTA-5024 TaxID=316330 RepID=UPI00055BE122|nr:amidohydrolase [Microbispora sp. ATCC PTA-5024]
MKRELIADWMGELDAFLDREVTSLYDFRRDIHMNPELGFQEFRTTRQITKRLEDAGLVPKVLPKGTGAICDVGTGEGPIVALRADIDALPLTDEKPVSYRSTAPDACHACGHDVHTTVVLGAGMFLADLAARNRIAGTIRLLFQPAEESLLGALEVVAAGGLADVRRIFTIHCDPSYEVGQLGLRTGAIIAACDKVRVHITTPVAARNGGESPELVHALAKIITELPEALYRRGGPMSSLSLVWGMMDAGPVAHPGRPVGIVEGTVRCLDTEVRKQAPELIASVLLPLARTYEVEANLEYVYGVPPTLNESSCVNIFREVGSAILGRDRVLTAPQSLEGDDFGIYLQSVPGAYARLGVRSPGQSAYGLHQGTFDVDEACISVGIRLLALTALSALARESS